MKGAAREEVVRVADIEEPPYQIAVISEAHVRSIGQMMRGGAAPPKPVLAGLRDRYYPVGNIESVMAASVAGSRDIRCDVVPARSDADVMNLHLLYSRSRTYNPVRFIRMIRKAIKDGVRVDLGDIPRRFERPIQLDPEVEQAFDEFVLDLGRRFEEVPSMLHVIPPLSRLARGEQMTALRSIIKYTTIEKHAASPPDRIALIELFNQFKGGDPGEDRGAARAEPRDSEPRDSEAPDAGPRDAEVSRVSGGGRAGARIRPRRDSIQHRCTCGRSVTVNLKSGTVHRMEDRGSNILAVSDEENTSPCYQLPGEIAESLELDMGDVVHYYAVGGRSSGTVILSKGKIPRRVQAGLARMLKE